VFHAVAEATSVAPMKTLLCIMVPEVSKAVSSKREDEESMSRGIEARGVYVPARACGWVDAS
jgi:hypothetical protein